MCVCVNARQGGKRRRKKTDRHEWMDSRRAECATTAAEKRSKNSHSNAFMSHCAPPSCQHLLFLRLALLVTLSMVSCAHMEVCARACVLNLSLSVRLSLRLPLVSVLTHTHTGRLTCALFICCLDLLLSTLKKKKKSPPNPR